MGLFNLFKQTPTQKHTPKKAPELHIENVSIKRLIPQCIEWKNDLIIISSSKNCPICKKYNKKTYSLYGWNKKYPKAPEFILNKKCPECNKIIGATIKL